MKYTFQTLRSFYLFSFSLALCSFLAVASTPLLAEEAQAPGTSETTISAVPPAVETAAAVPSNESAEAAAAADPKESAEAPAVSAIKPPQVAIRMMGAEYNIQVLYEHAMDYANQDFIETIQMETPEGEFLGMTQFGPNAKEAYGEFMVNQSLAKFKEIVLIATSPKDGVSRTTVKLEVTEKSEIERPGIVSNSSRPVPSKSKEAASPKKGKKFKIF